MCGSTPTTCATRTGAATTWTPGGRWSTGPRSPSASPTPRQGSRPPRRGRRREASREGQRACSNKLHASGKVVHSLCDWWFRLAERVGHFPCFVLLFCLGPSSSSLLLSRSCLDG